MPKPRRSEIQLASATVAAVRTDALMDRLARLEEMSQERTMVSYHRNATADVSRGLLILACVGLIALFVGGLAFSTRKDEMRTSCSRKLDTLLRNWSGRYQRPLGIDGRFPGAGGG